MMRLAILTALVAVVAAVAVPLAGAGVSVAPYDRDLGVSARWSLDAAKFSTTAHPTRFVYVRCYRSDADFDGAGAWRFGESMVNRWAYSIRWTVYMRGRQCRLAHQFISRMLAQTTQAVTPAEVGAYATLLHESLHVQGIRDEQVTECLANDSVRWVALGYDIPKSEANRLSRMAFSWSYRNVAASYQSDPTSCEKITQQYDWASYVGT